MAGGKSDYLENLIVNLLMGKVGSPYTPPATLYIALFTVLPGEDGTGGTEVSGGSYARVALTNNTTNFPTVSDGNKKNGTIITFPTPTGSWGTVVGMGVYDAASAGNLFYYSSLAASRAVASGQVQRFAVGALQIAEQ